MKKLMLLILVLMACNNKHKAVDKNLSKDLSEVEGTSPEAFEIDALEFHINPAEMYFYTRRYKLNKEQLFYRDEDYAWKASSTKNHELALALLDQLPTQVLSDKKHLGHPTVPMDEPDWYIAIISKSKDTLHLRSGGLPDYMKDYNNLAWNTMRKLDASRD